MYVAGYLSDAETPPADFILVGQKLEQLGFTYFKGKVVIIEPELERKLCLGSNGTKVYIMKIC